MPNYITRDGGAKSERGGYSPIHYIYPAIHPSVRRGSLSKARAAAACANTKHTRVVAGGRQRNRNSKRREYSRATGCSIQGPLCVVACLVLFHPTRLAFTSAPPSFECTLSKHHDVHLYHNTTQEKRSRNAVFQFFSYYSIIHK